LEVVGGSGADLGAFCVCHVSCWLIDCSQGAATIGIGPAGDVGIVALSRRGRTAWGLRCSRSRSAGGAGGAGGGAGGGWTCAPAAGS